MSVTDLVIHPREGDLVLGTYGRGFWTGDITPLQELTPEVLDKNVHLFDIEARPRYGFSGQGMNYHLFGDRFIEVPNERDALTINYYLKAADSAGARVTITDVLGKPMAQLSGPARAGLNRAEWNMQITAGTTPPAGPPARGGGGGGRGGQMGPPAPVGDYVVTVEAGGEKLTKLGKIRERIR